VGGRTVNLIKLVKTFEVEQQLPTDGVHHSTVMAEGKACTGSNHASLQERIGHTGHGLHGQDRIPDAGCRHIVLAQDAQSSQLTQILECIGRLLGNESGSFPPL
jgi:hypothetical protein